MRKTDIDDPIGALLGGRFRIESLLGRGGMAAVYLATDEFLGRSVAIKVFRRDLADGEDLQRQKDEIQLLATLNHPGLVTLFDASTDEAGNAFLVMELVSGIDLRSRLSRGPLEPSEVAAVGQWLADALAYIHSKDVIHRDVKPANILLPDVDADHTGPLAKLADFGIARIVDGSRLTATGQVLGTASYFSPEQALGASITPASDIYSLGLVLMECLTGTRAFPGPALESMMARVAREPEVPDTVDPDWSRLLRAMTTREAGVRPSAREVSVTLAGLTERLDPTKVYATVDPMEQPADSPTELIDRVPRAARRKWPWRRISMVAGAAAALLLLGWLVSVVLAGMPATPDVPAAPDYPAVDGELGTHLEQLQRTVEP